MSEKHIRRLRDNGVVRSAAEVKSKQTLELALEREKFTTTALRNRRR